MEFMAFSACFHLKLKEIAFIATFDYKVEN